ncbi:hypothetical protein, partial [Mesorhizobium sp. M1C.F.Ca.ET.188.01.1.1]|uniref:hypothetical protein n=1 Tax=Mesorhizobium sp. M1C.F.Ca.ET.188.01.1.1 TaxID=2563924 RepID=UPI001AEDA13F
DGEKGAGRSAGALSATLMIGEIGDDSVPLPVTIRGEGAGRQVRGGADVEKVQNSSLTPKPLSLYKSMR